MRNRRKRLIKKIGYNLITLYKGKNEKMNIKCKYDIPIKKQLSISFFFIKTNTIQKTLNIKYTKRKNVHASFKIEIELLLTSLPYINKTLAKTSKWDCIKIS